MNQNLVNLRAFMNNDATFYPETTSELIKRVLIFEAGVTFDNSFFNNYFDFLQQLKNGSFLGPVFVHVTGRS
jgi:hypothetical protein